MPNPQCQNNCGAMVFAMKSRQGCKGYIMEARSYELNDGGFSAEFSVEEHDSTGVTESQLYLPDTFPTLSSLPQYGRHAAIIRSLRLAVGFPSCTRSDP